MKLNTAVIIFKGSCYFLVGVFTPWTAALTQWVNSGEWPGKIIWLGVILPMSVVGGGSALLAFLNSSFTDYEQQKLADDTGKVQTVETVPTVKATPPDYTKAKEG